MPGAEKGFFIFSLFGPEGQFRKEKEIAEMDNDEIKKDEKVEADLDTMAEKVGKITLLDNKIYEFRPLVFNDAIELIGRMNSINIVNPVINLVDEETRNTLIEVLEKMFSYNYPDLQKDIWLKLIDLSHVRRIIEIAIDVNGIHQKNF